MAMITIDGRRIEANDRSTVMAAARAEGIEIPNLCYLDTHEAYGSCALCVVEEASSGRLLISCTSPVEEGMELLTESEAVLDSRKTALELLLSEHVGDCEAPCRIACPAGFDAALLMDLLESGETDSARVLVEAELPLASILCHACAAPCESACRRAKLDQAISIRASILDLMQQEVRERAACAPASGKRAAIVGGGPVGLGVAVRLLAAGHQCTVYVTSSQAGGSLCTTADPEVLEHELNRLGDLGCSIQTDVVVGHSPTWDQIRESSDVVVLACGSNPRSDLGDLGLEVLNRRIVVAPKTYETTVPGIFAGGDVVRPVRTLQRTASDARSLATAVDQFLRGVDVTGERKRFLSRIGRLAESELGALCGETNTTGPGGEGRKGDLKAEAGRCLQCGCFEREACLLRRYAEIYDVDTKRFRSEGRIAVERKAGDAVVHEPGKCISCARCVRLSANGKKSRGMTMLQRGYNMRIDVPFGDSLDSALEGVECECVGSCPTGALASRQNEKDTPRRRK